MGVLSSDPLLQEGEQQCGHSQPILFSWSHSRSCENHFSICLNFWKKIILQDFTRDAPLRNRSNPHLYILNIRAIQLRWSPCYMPPWCLEKFGVRGASELNGYDVYNFFNLQSRNTHYSLKTWKFAEEGDSLLKSCDGSWDYRTRRKQNRVHFSGNTLTRFIWGWICFVW